MNKPSDKNNSQKVNIRNKDEKTQLDAREMSALEEELRAQNDELKETFEKLKKSEEKFRLAMEASQEGLWDWDISSNHVYYSKGWHKILGVKQLPFEFSAWETRIHPDDKMLAINTIGEHIKGTTKFWSLEHRLKVKTGEWKWVLGRGQVTERDGNGVAQRMIGTMIDISQRKKIEKALEESKEKAVLYLNVAAELIISLDTKGTITLLNDSGHNLLGYKKGALIGENWFDTCIPKKLKNEIKNVFKKLMKGEIENVRNYENAIITKTGKEKILNWHNTIIKDNKGNITGLLSSGQDITERKKTEKILGEKEIQFKALFESSPDLVALTNLKGKILDINRVAPGYKKDDVIGTNVKDYLTLEQKKEFKSTVEKVLETEQPSSYEPVIIDPEGLTKYWYNRVSPFKTDGKIDKLVINFTDITDRRIAENTIKESEERFRELVNTINSGVAIYTVINDGKKGSDYIIQDFNTFALNHEGMSKEEVIGKSLQDIRPNIEKYGLIDVFRKVWETGKPEFFPAKIYVDEKYENYYENRIFRLPSGEIVAIYDDITTQKNADLKLEESEKRFSYAMDATSDGIYDWNLVTNEIYYSPNWKKMLGYEDHELPNDFTVWEKLTNPEDVKKSWEMQNELINKQRDRFVMTFKMKHKEGHWIDILSRADAIFDTNDKATRIVGTHVDITESKKTEHELIKAKEKAEESDRLKSAFLANMSHEIRTPMNGILGFTEILNHQGLSNEEKEKYIKIIQDSGNRMLSTVNDLIDISKIETKQVKINKTVINLNQEIQKLYQFFTIDCKKKGLQLLLENSIQEHQSIIRTDRTKLISIFTNLINNAIKYTEKGFVLIGCEKVDQMISCYVKDSGIGIPKNRQKAIFNRFEQADINDSNAFQGSGLGLAITKAYVEMLDGEISLQSELGKGSTFYFSLPTQEKIINKANINTPVSEISDKTAKKIKIIIADDDKTSRLHLFLLLKEIANEIIEVSNGKEAIEMCEKHPDTNILLMDIKMPKINGLEATLKIREFNKTIYIIGQSAYALSGDKEEALKAGCNDYITKPINKEILIQKVMHCTK